MLEFWHIGLEVKLLRYHGFWDNEMVGIENQNEYNCIDFLVITAYFLRLPNLPRNLFNVLVSFVNLSVEFVILKKHRKK